MLAPLRSALGCGLDGLDWAIVSGLITEAMAAVAETGVNVLVFPPIQR